MATSDLWESASASESSATERIGGPVAQSTGMSKGTAKLWMVLDGVTILGAAAVATLYKMHTGPLAGVQGFWDGTLIYGRSMGILLALLSG